MPKIIDKILIPGGNWGKKDFSNTNLKNCRKKLQEGKKGVCVPPVLVPERFLGMTVSRGECDAVLNGNVNPWLLSQRRAEHGGGQIHFSPQRVRAQLGPLRHACWPHDHLQLLEARVGGDQLLNLLLGGGEWQVEEADAGSRVLLHHLQHTA